jgi:hypothetical protein
MAAGEMEVLLEVGGFDIDGGRKMIMTQVHIDVQKCDFGGGGVHFYILFFIFFNLES